MEKNSNNEGRMNRRIMIGAIVAGVLIIALIALVVADSLAIGNLYLENKTDKNIENMIIYFQDYEDNFIDNIFEGKLDAGESIKLDYGTAIRYAGEEYECCIRLKIEGADEMLINDGMFESDFNGNIRLRFFQKDGQYYLHTKAGLGVFESTQKTDMDTDIILYLDESDWDYIL
ncbi:MAG: hypothetical protein K6E85_15580 [Lachnospiraceae bacterium]|nr:hypothetical protein [Lachnospiraceae bacterium]